jgi:hypothetical protein
VGRTLIKVFGKDVKIEGRWLRIAHLDGDKYDFPVDPHAFVNQLKACGTRIDLFTFLEKFPTTEPKYPYPIEWDNLAVLPVSTFDHWWTQQIRSFPRNRARQAEKRGVVLREVPFGDALVQGICEIYNECPIRQGKPFVQYGINFERAREYAGTFLDRSFYVGAFLGDKMIGFAKLVTDETQTYACIVHILSMIQHKDKAPTNALIAQAVRFCASRGISYLVYENFSYGKKEGDSLGHFKEVNGFQRVDLPRYYVPLTRLGSVAFHLGLHHKLVEYLPESITAKLREFRTAWYSRKYQLAKEVR